MASRVGETGRQAGRQAGSERGAIAVGDRSAESTSDGDGDRAGGKRVAAA